MMQALKRHIPSFIKKPLILLIEAYHLTPFYRNRLIPLGGRLAGFSIYGGKLTGIDQGTYEDSVCRVIERLVKPGMVCVDVGAHIGYMTLLMARLVGPGGQVVAFEAHPTNAAYVQRNILFNHLESTVIVHNLAVSDGQSQQVFLSSGRNYRSAEWRIQANSSKNGFLVPSVSLDQHFPPGQRVDFVKMDIEGAEAQALPGMVRLLHEFRPSVCIEFHGETAWKAREILVKANYRLYDIQQSKWIADERFVYHCLAVPQEKTADLDSF